MSNKAFVHDVQGPGARWVPGEVFRVMGQLSYQVRADVEVMKHYVDKICQTIPEASDLPEEE